VKRKGKEGGDLVVESIVLANCILEAKYTWERIDGNGRSTGEKGEKRHRKGPLSTSHNGKSTGFKGCPLFDRRRKKKRKKGRKEEEKNNGVTFHTSFHFYLFPYSRNGYEGSAAQGRERKKEKWVF